MSTATIIDESRNVREAVLEAVLREGVPLVMVPSPPGAGKTHLVETVVVAAVDIGLRVGVIAPRVEQTIDFMRRLRALRTAVPTECLLAKERDLPPDLTAGGIATCRRFRDLSGARPGLVVSSVDKLATIVADLPDSYFDLLIVDEAWQVTAKDFLLFAAATEQALLVGDPGQLPPLVRSDTGRLESRAHRVHWPAPRELLRRFPNSRVIALPATRRFPQDTVDFIQPAFYPELPFVSSVPDAERRLQFAAAGMHTPIDLALDRIAAGDSIVGVLLEERHHPGGEVDVELVDLAAAVAARVEQRQPRWVGQRELAAHDIGCVDPHRDSGTATRRALSNHGFSEDLVVTTPEIWQGLQRPLMIARHPILPGRRQTAFDLDPGRFCVMLSRHQIGCVLVGREGIGEALDRHQHDCAARAMEADNSEWNGWRAHASLWGALEAAGRLIRI
jgi:hypothetical protein